MLTNDIIEYHKSINLLLIFINHDADITDISVAIDRSLYV